MDAHAPFRVLGERCLELFDVEVFADDQCCGIGRSR